MKEIKLSIELENNSGAVETDIIKGDLDCVLINPLGLTDIQIKSELGYVILDVMQLEKINYIPLRTQSWDKEGHRISFSSEKFKLNERLIIYVSSSGTDLTNKEIEVIIRYE